MKSVSSIIIACLVPLTLLLAQAQTAQGVGYGLTKDAAIEQAKRDAVENGLGAYISSGINQLTDGMHTISRLYYS